MKSYQVDGSQYQQFLHVHNSCDDAAQQLFFMQTKVRFNCCEIARMSFQTCYRYLLAEKAGHLTTSLLSLKFLCMSQLLSNYEGFVRFTHPEI